MRLHSPSEILIVITLFTICLPNLSTYFIKRRSGDGRNKETRMTKTSKDKDQIRHQHALCNARFWNAKTTTGDKQKIKKKKKAKFYLKIVRNILFA